MKNDKKCTENKGVDKNKHFIYEISVHLPHTVEVHTKKQASPGNGETCSILGKR